MAEQTVVPYMVFESTQARHERIVKRLVIALVLTILLIFASNLAWLYVWNQYDYKSTATTTTYEQDGEGINLIGDKNEVYDDGTTPKYYSAKAPTQEKER